ncbi:aspartate/glutamate racemase family protein [Actinoplanes sp. TFC3]|uniref:aspartate/glutamate racemase family protein n=1 Tax=Actinoplanes sp. TFC3 TaxID=1710355 RepID=UPI000830EB48|nr:aspartate/glutamate racemase family protein [Actinoplanes sp. TFC3]
MQPTASEPGEPARRRRIGVIGGVGPLATAWLYERLVALSDPRGSGHYPDIVIHNLPFEVRSEVAFVAGDDAGEDAEHLTDQLVRSVRVLATAGAGHVLLPCNTLHSLLPAVRARLGTQAPQVAHMPQLTAQAVPAGSRVLVLGTGATVRLDYYGGLLRERDCTVTYLDSGDQDWLETLIQRAISENLAGLWPAIEQMVAAHVAVRRPDVVLLACTDLDTLGLDQVAGIPAIGSLQTLAGHGVTWLRGEQDVLAGAAR